MRLLVLFMLLAQLLGCTQKTTSASHRKILAFGTIVNITIYHPDKKLVARAFDRLEADFLTMHRLWHPWEPGPLSRTNQLLQTGEWFSAAPSVLPLISRSKELAIQSRHFFNPAMGKLIKGWGFHRNEPNQPFTIDQTEIKRLQANIPNMEAVEIDGIRLRGHHPDLQIDVGGIGKGFGIDQAILTLKAMGIDNAIINAGGDLRAIGQHGNRPWKIGIQHPRKNQVLASIKVLNDESIFTSGDYQRYYRDNENRRRSHIIDPLTGIPVNHTMAVTVIHENATIADAATTALMAAGPDRWYEIAQALGIRYVLLMARNGTLHMNPAMQRRLTLSGPDRFTVHLSPPLM